MLYFQRYWRCIKRAKCPGRLHTTLYVDGHLPGVVHGPTKHSHEPEIKKTIRGKNISEMRKKVKLVPHQPLKATFDGEITSFLATILPADRVLVPDYGSCLTILKLQRKMDIPKLPASRTAIDLTGTWSKDLDGERFVLQTDSEDIIIFATNKSLKYLTECETIYMDGTFSRCPQLFTQLYSIHGLYKGVSIPLVYMILTNKTATMYNKAFTIVRNALFELKMVWNPKLIITDFESGIIEVIKCHFPNALHKGCHFHFCNAIWTKVQNLGLVIAFREEPEIAEYIGLLMSLAFLPETEVWNRFYQITAGLTDAQNQFLLGIKNYFLTTWMDGIFPIKMWNQFNCDNDHRTNNKMESLKKKLPPKPNIYVFVKTLQSDNALANIMFSKADLGEEPPRRKTKYITFENSLQKAWNKYLTGDIDVTDLHKRCRHYIRKFK